MSTLSDYYNNPGNLRPPKGVTYEGQIGVGDGGFAIFETKEYGRQALINDIEHKVGKGIDTPSAFVDRYAPAGDNSEEARDNYKIHIAEQLGLKSTGDKFPKDSFGKIADAITQFEGGIKPPEPEAEKEVAADENEGSIDQRSNQTVAPAQAHELDTLPITAQSLITGGAGAALGSGVGLAKYPLVYAVHQMVDDKNKHTAPSVSEVQSSEWPGTKTSSATSPSHSERQVLSTGDKSDMTGRERQIGYTESTAQQAARKGTQYETAKSVGLNPDRAFAAHPDVASTRGGILAGKQTIDELYGQQLAAKNAQAQRGLNAANVAGQQWQNLLSQAKTFMQIGNPQEKAWAAKVLDKLMGGVKTAANSFAGRTGQIGFGFGAAVPMAWEEYKDENPKTAAAILGAGTTLGALAHKFPRATTGAGALATLGYDVTHPRQAAAAMTMRDVSPTAFSGMPEETEAAFPEYQDRNAGGGRGFVNPPLARP